MNRRKLGNSELSIAPLAFSGNVFGWTIDEPTSFQFAATTGGTLLGPLIGGRRGAGIGALIGAGSGALYTYKINPKRRRYYGDYGNNVYQIAQQNGYNDGLRKGQQDAREGHNNPQGTSEYKYATNGYDSSLGNKGAYKQAYRQGFLQGFSEAQNNGYYNNGGYPNNYPNNRRNRNNNGANILRRIIIGH